jgi:hypothetical protein
MKKCRLKLPDKKIMEGIIKVFVATGPSQDDPGCNEDHWVEVDLLEPGESLSEEDIVLVLRRHRPFLTV